MSDHLSTRLNLVPLVDEPEPNTEIVSVEESTDPKSEQAERDFDTARKNIETVINVTQGALKDLGGLAHASQLPRAYEALTELAKAAVEANKALLEIHRTRKEIDNFVDITKKKDDSKITQNNLILVGTTADLQRAVKEVNQGLIIAAQDANN